MIAKSSVSPVFLSTKIFATCIGGMIAVAGLVNFVLLYGIVTYDVSRVQGSEMDRVRIIFMVSSSLAYTCIGIAILLRTWQKTWTREFFIFAMIGFIMLLPSAFSVYQLRVTH